MRRIIDRRRKKKFMMDDQYLNGQAKICGWQATLVYLSLCRHTNISQESFPSIRLMSEELCVSRNTVLKGIKNLEKFNVVSIKKTRSKKGKWLNNLYILQDKSVWKTDQVLEKNMDNQALVETPPSPYGIKAESPIKTLRKHIKENTYKESGKTDEELKRVREQLKRFKPDFLR
jgi:DNA-binding transcriptional regulator YhcF (GntR family)